MLRLPNWYLKHHSTPYASTSWTKLSLLPTTAYSPPLSKLSKSWLSASSRILIQFLTKPLSLSAISRNLSASSISSALISASRSATKLSSSNSTTSPSVATYFSIFSLRNLNSLKSRRLSKIKLASTSTNNNANTTSNNR